MKIIALKAINFYQVNLRRLHNRECIYEPTCSEYAKLSISKYGFIKGIKYSYLRIKRCNGAIYQGGKDFP